MTRIAVGALLWVLTACATGVARTPADREADLDALRALHEASIQAHLDGDADFFVQDLADGYVQVSGASVQRPAREEVREGFQRYLESTEFTRYETTDGPLVGVSDDGSIGWIIVRVEVEGVWNGTSGVAFASAWISLYRRADAGWEFLANVSSVEPLGASDSVRPAGVLGLHHAHLNSVDVAAALAWYETVWPAGQRGALAGHPAFLAEMPLLFTEVGSPPRGAWRHDLRRPADQSPIWHIGAFTNTTGRFARLAEAGHRVLPLFVGPADTAGVLRSGLAPYAGIADAARLDTVASEEPRDGGFGYLLGPDGVLFELTGGPRTTDSFSHVHLFHEEPRCAANWYVDVLGMTLPPGRDASGAQVPRERWDACDAEELGGAGWPSLEPVGTLRSPNARIV